MDKNIVDKNGNLGIIIVEPQFVNREQVKMIPQDLKPGTRLELELLSRNGKRVGITHISQFLETQENGCLIISAPILEARLIYIPVSAQLNVYFMHPKYGPMGFSATVTEIDYRGKIAVLTIEAASELKKHQRRNHYRQDHMEKALIWVCGKDDKQDKKAASKASTKNISGSGLCVVMENDIPKGTEIDIEFNLTESILIRAKCIVIRNKSFEVKNRTTYEIGLKYTELSDKDQDSIIRYIFGKQRAKLKR